MRKTDWRKYIYRVSIVILIIFFVVGVGFGAKKIFTIEGVRELYTAPAPLSEKPETAQEMLNFINAAVEKALQLSPKTELTASFTIDKDSLQVSSGSRAFVSAVLTAVPGVNKSVAGSFEKKTADYSVSAADFLKTFHISASDVTGAQLKYEYYKCALCTSEIAFEDYAPVCPECGSENTLQLRFYDTYKITLHVAPGSAGFSENPFPKAENLREILQQEGENYYAVRDFSLQYDDAVLYAEVNRLTDQIGLLRFETKNAFSAELGMAGAYEPMGTVTVTANAADRVNWKFTWPSVKLDKHETTVELGSNEVLKAKLTCDDPAGHSVTWTSSDESVLTVDEEGYLHTKKVYGDSTVTATLTFNGKQYSDSCLVHVGVPAEGVDLSKGKLSLKTGETALLEAKFNPKDTTNTKCYWYSEDPSVARVDGNGVVTAVAPGKTVIYIITDDGNYYSSCKTEVTD